MDQYLNNRRTELFWELLANPAGKDEQHADNLAQLTADFPQCGLLQALHSYTGAGAEQARAAAYYNPKLLYKLHHHADDFPALAEGQILKPLAGVPAARFFHTEELPELEDAVGPVVTGTADLPDETLPGNIIAPDHLLAPYTEGNGNLYAINEPGDNREDLPAFGEEFSHMQVEPQADEQPIVNNEEHIPPTTVQEQEPSPQPIAEDTGIATQIDNDSFTEPSLVPHNNVQPIDDEVYEEIVSIDDINLGQDYKPAPENIQQETQPLPADSNERKPPLFNHREVDLTDEAEKLILNNIAATDFFVFDRAFGERKKGDESADNAAQAPIAAIEENSTASADQQDISKYHDEKMPYSFMWWLNKTRREHAGTYQPYVEFKLDTTQSISKNVPDELQQQYYENIFNITSVDELERSTAQRSATPVVLDPKKKEDEIIERFIQEVPVIKPQTGEKLDNENKAKKSAEDHDELVTETLARIYEDQMLYPKAIATYKKLMLKFPEKSRYFASQIEQLEKRTS